MVYRIGTPAIFAFFSKQIFFVIGACVKKGDQYTELIIGIQTRLNLRC